MLGLCFDQMSIRELNEIIERPNLLGCTVFSYASIYSKNISMAILDRNIAVDYIDDSGQTPQFNIDSDLAEAMLRNKINPFIKRNQFPNK
jgi:hypothetical protein